MEIDSLIDQFCEDIHTDALAGWASILKVEYNPPLDDDMPDWEDELRTKLADTMKKVGTK